MMIFTSLYVVVDGLFISNISGPDSFAAVNLIYPMIMIVGGIGYMFGSGGAALAGKLLGEKNNIKANELLSMMIYSSFILVLIISIITFFFVDDLTILLAKTDPSSSQKMIDDAIMYGRILILGQPIFAIQTLFQSFFVVDERPALGFVQTLIAGITNIIFDAIFIAGFKLGVIGAAIGTILGYFAGAIFPLLYFKNAKNNLITIKWAKPDFKSIFKCMGNGVSDFIFNISASIVGIVFNYQLLKYMGQTGINVFGVLMYLGFVFVSIFIGISIAMGPVISYNFGAKNDIELKSIIKKILILIGIIAVLMVIIGEALAYPLSCLFSNDPNIVAESTKAMRIYSVCFLMAGFSIFITAMFTALNDGLVSGILSLFRTLIFQILFVFVVPLFLGPDGIWWSAIFSDVSSIIMCAIFFFTNRKKYKYWMLSKNAWQTF